MNCFDDSPLFVAVWYTLATLPVMALGGIIGAICLLLSIPIIRPFILSFGYPEVAAVVGNTITLDVPLADSYAARHLDPDAGGIARPQTEAKAMMPSMSAPVPEGTLTTGMPEGAFTTEQKEYLSGFAAGLSARGDLRMDRLQVILLTSGK